MSFTKNLIVISAITGLALTGCARSGGEEALSDDAQEEVDGAKKAGTDAQGTADGNTEAIDELDGRVDELEVEVDDLQGGGGAVDDEARADIADLENGQDQNTGDIADLQTEVDDLGVRVDMIDARWPPSLSDVVVLDKDAAGFPTAAPIDNAEQGMNYINQRIGVFDIDLTDVENQVDAVEGGLESLEVSFNSTLATTVQNYITEQITQGNITVDADLGFNASPDVNPMDNGLGVVQYSDSTQLEDAIRALRFANQVKVIVPPTDTLLGGLARDYVQEAIEVLDKSGYDVVNGNVAIDIHTDSTVDGTDIDTYISNVVEADTTLLTNIFDTTYFETAVTNVINDPVANVTVDASQVDVDNTNLGGVVLTVQEAVEYNYAWAETNAADIDAAEVNITNILADIAALDVDVTGIALNAAAIANIISTADTGVTNLQTLQDAVDALDADITTVEGDITNIQTAIGNIDAAGVPFDNTAYTAFDGGTYNNDNVQEAIGDIHDYVTQLGVDLTTITAGGGVATDASLVTYVNNGQTTVEGALDDIYLNLTIAQTVLADGYAIFAGQDLNQGVQDLDTAVGVIAGNLAAAEANIADILTNGLTALQAQVDANRADIDLIIAGANTAVTNLETLQTAVDVNAANITANTNLINVNIASIQANTDAIADVVATDVAALQAQIDANAANIVANADNITANADNITANADNITTNADNITTNADGVANNAAVIADLIARIDELEATSAKAAYILGVSDETSTGRFEFNGATGVAAATEMCKAAYADEATAHLCTPDEAQRSLASQSYGDPADFDNEFTWTITGITRKHLTENVFAGANSLVPSCNNFLYNSGDVATGTRLKVDIDMASFGTGGVGIAGDAVIIQPNRGCAEAYPVLCCR